jgi:hydrogenase large subunit
MTDWGNEMFVTPGVVVDGELVTTDLVDINLGIRILLGSARTTTTGSTRRRSSRTTRSATRSTKRHPWNQTRSPSRRSATSRAATTAG